MNWKNILSLTVIISILIVLSTILINYLYKSNIVTYSSPERIHFIFVFFSYIIPFSIYFLKFKKHALPKPVFMAGLKISIFTSFVYMFYLYLRNFSNDFFLNLPYLLLLLLVYFIIGVVSTVLISLGIKFIFSKSQ